jgi:hypothetical protein
MDDIECLKSDTISELRRLVKKENMPTLGNVEARSIEVYENGSEDTVCSPAKLLSACASGGPELPFIIYHPPGSTLFVSHLRYTAHVKYSTKYPSRYLYCQSD